jgi:hypothetical protein
VTRRADIEAAIAAHNSADRETLLPPSAAQLLSVMFRRSSVCQRTLDDLASEGFSKRILSLLLRSLVEAGFVSRQRDRGTGASYSYRLHLPPVRR